MARRVLKLFSFDVFRPTGFRFFFTAGPSSLVEGVSALDSGHAAGMTSRMDESAADLNQTVRGLLDEVARTLGVPLALLSRDQAGWRFEAEAFPPRPVADAPRFRAPTSDWLPGPSRGRHRPGRVAVDRTPRRQPARSRVAPHAAGEPRSVERRRGPGKRGRAGSAAASNRSSGWTMSATSLDCIGGCTRLSAA